MAQNSFMKYMHSKMFGHQINDVIFLALTQCEHALCMPRESVLDSCNSSCADGCITGFNRIKIDLFNNTVLILLLT